MCRRASKHFNFVLQNLKINAEYPLKYKESKGEDELNKGSDDKH